MVVWSGCAIITNRSFIQTFLYLTSEICAPLTAAPQGSLKNHKLTRARSQTDTAEWHAGFLLDNHSRKPRAAAGRDVPPLCRLLSRGSRVTTPQEPHHRLPRPQGECARTAAAETRSCASTDTPARGCSSAFAFLIKARKRCLTFEQEPSNFRFMWKKCGLQQRLKLTIQQNCRSIHPEFRRYDTYGMV